jgi:hypothetical protein
MSWYDDLKADAESAGSSIQSGAASVEQEFSDAAAGYGAAWNAGTSTAGSAIQQGVADVKAGAQVVKDDVVAGAKDATGVSLLGSAAGILTWGAVGVGGYFAVTSKPGKKLLKKYLGIEL